MSLIAIARIVNTSGMDIGYRVFDIASGKTADVAIMDIVNSMNNMQISVDNLKTVVGGIEPLNDIPKVKIDSNKHLIILKPNKNKYYSKLIGVTQDKGISVQLVSVEGNEFVVTLTELISKMTSKKKGECESVEIINSKIVRANIPSSITNIKNLNRAYCIYPKIRESSTSKFGNYDLISLFKMREKISNNLALCKDISRSLLLKAGGFDGVKYRGFNLSNIIKCKVLEDTKQIVYLDIPDYDTFSNNSKILIDEEYRLDYLAYAVSKDQFILGYNSLYYSNEAVSMIKFVSINSSGKVRLLGDKKTNLVIHQPTHDNINGGYNKYMSIYEKYMNLGLIEIISSSY